MNIEQIITTEEIDWSVLIVALLEDLTLNRYQLAIKIGVTEQAMSNWTTGYRKPSQLYRHKIIEVLKESGLNLNDYRKDNLKKDKIYNPTVRLQPDILEFSKKVYNQPVSLRKNILKMVDKVMKKM